MARPGGAVGGAVGERAPEGSDCRAVVTMGVARRALPCARARPVAECNAIGLVRRERDVDRDVVALLVLDLTASETIRVSPVRRTHDDLVLGRGLRAHGHRARWWVVGN